MRRLAVGLCFSLMAACNRTEEPHSLEDAHSAAQPVAPAHGAAAPENSAHGAKPSEPSPVSGESGATRATGGTAVAGCVVPMADEPPRRAQNALHCPADSGNPGELTHGYVVFADARLNVELARTEPEKERGLMFRTKMPDDQGMLFSWNNEEPRTFWMHNTCIPLDMMFITKDGTIAGILEQVPTLNDEARGVPCPAAYVLEVNAGWTRAHGVKPGTIVHFE